MCGIYGFYGKPKNAEALIKNLAIETEIRGKDSTGYFIVTPDDYKISKWAVSATDFYSHDDYKKDLEDATIFIGHNRAKSIGETTNINAHPFVGKRYALVHNGTCKQAIIDADQKGLKRIGTTDSEAILANIENEGIDYISKCYSYSVVVYDMLTETIYFSRDNSKPMWIFKVEGATIFSSTKKIGLKAIEKSGIKIKSSKRLVANRLYRNFKIVKKWKPVSSGKAKKPTKGFWARNYKNQMVVYGD